MFKFKMPQISASQQKLLLILSVAVFLDVVLWWPASKPEVELSLKGAENELIYGMTFTQALPTDLQFDAEKVTLGRNLFEDARLSSDNTISCASCHVLSAGGTDNRQHSLGVNGAEGGINAPTVFNSGFNFVQFWDGRAATLEDQAEGPVHHPKEMASNWPLVIERLSQVEGYRTRFKSIYGTDEIRAADIKDAIATFERSLVTVNSRFDKFLRGDESALSAQEQRGHQLFQSYGCVACHQGVNLGGNMYERMGLLGDYFGERGNLTDADYGRFNVTHKESDRYYFRVPSLRNVAKTAPYFHDGNAPTLVDAVRVMAKYQLGRPMPEEDVQAIVAFLHTLTGEFDGRPL